MNKLHFCPVVREKVFFLIFFFFVNNHSYYTFYGVVDKPKNKYTFAMKFYNK
jgi:hypothetical protein